MENESNRALTLPLILGLVAFLISQGFQTVELVRGHSNLSAERQAQEEQIAKSNQLRQQLSTLLNKTSDLAKGGDAEAKTIVDDFAKRGITFVPTKDAKPAS